MTELIYNVLTAVVVALIGVIVRELIPYLKQKRIEATTQIRKTRWAWTADIIDAAVRAVEQTADSELHGKGKKDLAKQYVKTILRESNLPVDEYQIDKLIEAAVQAMNGGGMNMMVAGEGAALGENTEKHEENGADD